MGKIQKDIFGYPCEGTPKQMDELYDLINREDYSNPKFQKYMYVWIPGDNTGLRWYPKEQYCQHKGNNYIVAVAHYMGHEEAYKSCYSID